jgi:hypothetical protein
MGRGVDALVGDRRLGVALHEVTKTYSDSGVLDLFSASGYCPRMPDDADKLTPADAGDIAESISFALLFSGKKRVHDSDRLTASIAAKHIVRHLERSGFVLMKRPPIEGSAPLHPPASWPHTKRQDMK